MALRNMGFPLGLTRQFCKSGHVFFPIEIIDRVAYHKDMIFKTINLHIKDADGSLSFDDFRPHMGVEFTVFLDEFRVVDEFKGLAITFHNEIFFHAELAELWEA